MININLSTPKGSVYTSNEATFIVVHSDNGEFGILKDHIPVLTTITNGYIKIETPTSKTFITLVSAIFEFKNNTCNIISNVAAIGNTLEESNEAFNKIQADLIKSNKEDQQKFVENELQLKKYIKKAKAGI